MDVSNMAVEFANVSLKMQDSVNVVNTFTDNDGTFLLRNIHKGKYKLSISYFSQELYSQDIIIIDGNIDLGVIPVDCGITLNETVVTAKPTLKRRPGSMFWIIYHFLNLQKTGLHWNFLQQFQ